MPIVRTFSTGVTLGSSEAVAHLRPSWPALVYRYDRRGVGLSDRDVSDFSMEAELSDLVAVIRAVDQGPVAVSAVAEQGPVAMRCAVEHPELVSHLLLETTYATGAEWSQLPMQRVSRMALEEDWDLFLRLVTRVQYGWDNAEAERAIVVLKEGLSQDVVLAQWDAMGTHSAEKYIKSITVPTMLIQRGDNAADDQASASMRSLAARIPGAVLYRGAGPDLQEAIVDFVGGHSNTTHGVFRTVMFTDLVSSTALTQRVGDDAAHETVETHDDAVKRALVAHNGVEIKHTGDGIMAAFDSATDAARSAQQIAQVLTQQGVGVRVGLNAGEPIERGGDLFGTAVQLAARVCDAASDGQVLATGVVRDLTAGKGLNWSSEPSITAKGFDDPVPVYSLDVN